MKKVKVEKEKILKQGTKTLSEFKSVIARGNVSDMAVGFIIVNDILMPVIGAIIGGIDFTNLSLKIGEATITYGNFIQNVIDFLIIAACIFFIVKIIEKITKKAEKEAIVEEIKKDEKIQLLEEIRDLLKENKEIVTK